MRFYKTNSYRLKLAIGPKLLEYIRKTFVCSSIRKIYQPAITLIVFLFVLFCSHRSGSKGFVTILRATAVPRNTA